MNIFCFEFELFFEYVLHNTETMMVGSRLESLLK